MLKSDFAFDEELSRILCRLNLEPKCILDRNATFIIIKCIGNDDREIVLKYNHSGSKDADRRIRNEAIITREFSSIGPLKFLEYDCHGEGYLVTRFSPLPLLADYSLGDAHLVDLTAECLARFQAIAPDTAQLGIRDREPLSFYYLKVTLKNLIHLWPEVIRPAEGMRALWLVIRGLSAISATRVVCHADFLPTNLLYDRRADSITILDLEGLISQNHPLFDMLAFFTIDERRLSEWDWQRQFLKRYLARVGAQYELHAKSPRFVRAYRSILIFYLAYRCNESRIAAEKTDYFDGISRWSYLLNKSKKYFSRAAHDSNRPSTSLVDLRRDNLLRMLSNEGFHQHITHMLEAGVTPAACDNHRRISHSKRSNLR